MAIVRTAESLILDKANIILSEISEKYGVDYKDKTLVLTACRIAGYEYDGSIETIKVSVSEEELISTYVDSLVKELKSIEIPPVLALCSLCRENIPYAEQKQKGVYYTDYRLALYLSECISEKIQYTNTIIDTASGTGILLLAVALKCKNRWKKEEFLHWINQCVYACDISSQALTGIMIAALSLFEGNVELSQFHNHLCEIDSLTEQLPNNRKFDYVVGNPPWGKIKLTRHMFSTEHGIEHVYGDNYKEYDIEKFEESKKILAEYSNLVRENYSLCEKGEIDLYMPFMELAMKLVKVSGMASLIVPAGLIRSQGTEQLRKVLFNEYNYVKISVMDNRDKFFSIDTRFKYLVISFSNVIDKEGIFINKPTVEDGYIREFNGIKLLPNELRMLRADYSIPEVFTEIELEIFRKMMINGVLCNEAPEWKMNIVREVDMTAHADKFLKGTNKGVPVIEGRMVHNFRTGAKSYVSGQGRSAKWNINPIGKATIHSQYSITEDNLPLTVKDRIKVKRAGFCDIAGQTNERGMMASLIPEGVVCGNKVPTITFDNDELYNRIFLWIGIVNSFSFDWFLRRILTTTVNFFLLESIPLPKINIDSDEAKMIINNTKKLIEADQFNLKLEEMEKLRASIEIAIAKAYGLDINELYNILLDFPLLDRGQPCLNGEATSTVTRDCILMDFDISENSKKYQNRYQQAKKKGAYAFVNAEIQKEMVIKNG